MKIIFENKQSTLKISKNSLQALVRELLLFLEINTDEISFRFVTTKEICYLHEKFFNDSSPTDCITFPIDSLHDKISAPHCLGEIIICPFVALEYSKNHEIDPYEELTLYIIHGILHLLEFNDQTDEDCKRMRREEMKCLSFLKEKKLLLTPFSNK